MDEPDNVKDKIIVYRFRWVILVIFCLMIFSNAVMGVTFTSVTNVSRNFFGHGYYGTTSAINMLSTVSLILYPVGSVVGIIVMKQYDMKGTIVVAGTLNVVGSLIRYLAGVSINSLGYKAGYILIFFGQSLVSISGPVCTNLPPYIASRWFPVNERDLSTTIGAIFNPIGSAIGQMVAAVIVTQERLEGREDDDGATVHGMTTLLLVQLILCIISFLLALFLFQSSPPTPPSQSTKLKQQSENVDELVRSSSNATINHNYDTTADLSHNNASSLSQSNTNPIITNPPLFSYIAWQKFYTESILLFHHRDFILLLVAFSISYGMLNTFFTIINQLATPHGYSNTDTGIFCMICMITGLLGSAIASKLMEKTQAYRLLLKGASGCCLLASLFFLSMLYKDNFMMLVIATACLGIFALPLMPIMMENCVECTYPLSEDLSIGFMHNGANVMSILFVFAIQELLTIHDGAPEPFLPSSLFIISVYVFAFIILLQFKGEYKRLECDTKIINPLLDNDNRYDILKDEESTIDTNN